MKKIIILMILIGSGFVLKGLYEIYDIKKTEEEVMIEVKEELKEIDEDDTMNKVGHGYYNKDLYEKFKPKKEDVIGILEMPTINGELPIVEGVDEDDLKRGVGHYTGTAYPLENEQIVLSGHRDTVFRRLGDLKIGDVVTLKMLYGTFNYKVTETKIVSADDKTVIVPHYEEILTITTCYPFSYIGSAPDRYIVYAKPIDRVEE